MSSYVFKEALWLSVHLELMTNHHQAFSVFLQSLMIPSQSPEPIVLRFLSVLPSPWISSCHS